MTCTDDTPIYKEIQRLEQLRKEWIAKDKHPARIHELSNIINVWETRLQCGFYTCAEVYEAERIDSQIDERIWKKRQLKKGDQLDLF